MEFSQRSLDREIYFVFSFFDEAHHICTMMNTCHTSGNMPPHRHVPNNKISVNMDRKMETGELYVSSVCIHLRWSA